RVRLRCTQHRRGDGLVLLQALEQSAPDLAIDCSKLRAVRGIRDRARQLRVIIRYPEREAILSLHQHRRRVNHKTECAKTDEELAMRTVEFLESSPQERPKARQKWRTSADAWHCPALLFVGVR